MLCAVGLTTENRAMTCCPPSTTRLTTNAYAVARRFLVCHTLTVQRRQMSALLLREKLKSRLSAFNLRRASLLGSKPIMDPTSRTTQSFADDIFQGGNNLRASCHRHSLCLKRRWVLGFKLKKPRAGLYLSNEVHGRWRPLTSALPRLTPARGSLFVPASRGNQQVGLRGLRSESLDEHQLWLAL